MRLLKKTKRKRGYRPTPHLEMRLRRLWGELTSSQMWEERAEVGAYTKNACGSRVPIGEGGHSQNKAKTRAREPKA